MIIQLTDLNNNPVFINSDHIILITALGGNTCVKVTGGDYWNVKEDVFHVVDTINASQQQKRL